MPGCEYRSLCEIRTKFVRIWYEFLSVSSNLFVLLLHCSIFAPPFSIGALHASLCLQVPFHAWSPDIRHHTRRRFTPRPRVQAHEQESEAARGTGRGRAPTEAGSERSEASRRFGRTAGGHSEASSGAGHAVREVVVTMPCREDLGTAHLDPPLVRVTLAPRQPVPALTQRVAPGPNGR